MINFLYKATSTTYKLRCNMFYVYILRCFDNSYYIGQTEDLITRITQHNSGGIAGYTAERFPVTVLFSRAFESRDEAKLFEEQIKG
jgi:predicted GIY-YIG superfamily endonuclease